MIEAIEDYFALGCGRCPRFGTADCSTRTWAEGLGVLRRLCLEAGLAETVKWGHPTYVHAGRNVAIIGAMRGDFRLSFFHAALMRDPAGILERAGPNSASADMIRFRQNRQAGAMAETVAAYLAEAKGHAAAGLRPERTTRETEQPAELVRALAADPEMAAAFGALTPGRQRSYAIALGSAKRPETRVARIARFRDRILAGKGATER